MAATACADAAPGPVGTPLDGSLPPAVVEDSSGRRIWNHGPAERLNVHRDPDGRRATLLFLEGRATTPLARGGSAWADLERGRVLVFDATGSVAAVLDGAPEGADPLTRPAFVATGPGTRVLASELDGSGLRFEEGRPAEWVASTVEAPWVGGDPGLRAAARTLFDVSLVPLRPEEPLLWIEADGRIRGVDRIRMPAQAMLAPLVNSGWVATDGADAVYFASALRPEIRKYAADGAPLWTATWPREAHEPGFGVTGGTLTPVFRVVQQAAAVGPDGALYVLATAGAAGPAGRLLVFRSDGTLLREGAVGPMDAVYVGERGHVFTASAERALARTAERGVRRAYEPFRVPELFGGDSVRLADHHGKVVVVNFWASWCVPCRREMPLLDALAEELDPERAVVLGLNEDVDPDAARRFVEELGGVGYPIGEGRGRLRDVYGYRGLPFTVVLDTRGRLVRALYGFGDSIDPIRSALERELDAG